MWVAGNAFTPRAGGVCGDNDQTAIFTHILPTADIGGGFAMETIKGAFDTCHRFDDFYITEPRAHRNFPRRRKASNARSTYPLVGMLANKSVLHFHHHHAAGSLSCSSATAPNNMYTNGAWDRQRIDQLIGDRRAAPIRAAPARPTFLPCPRHAPKFCAHLAIIRFNTCVEDRLQARSINKPDSASIRTRKGNEPIAVKPCRLSQQF